MVATCIALPLAQAEETVCARVKIEIKQELTLERQAFDAEMRINNTTDTSVIENVSVVVKVMDENGTPVVVTDNPNDLSAKFFVRLSNKQNISGVDGTGVVNPGTTSIINWLLIPAPGSAGTSPLGKKYLVGATLKYTFGGEETILDISPDVITVKPLPLLTLDYFLTQDAWADDPLTPEIEPAEPFTLGVRVKNTGYATAKNLAIDSAQPRIIENNQDLLINFAITGSYVDDAPAQNTLLINFGDLAAGASKMGRWIMETTLAGKFTEFTAKFSHADELGGSLTSILQATSAHILIRDVRVDLPGRDAVRDFLARDGDVIRVYESDGPDTEVTDRSGVATLTAGTNAAGNASYRLSFPATAGFVYVKLPDPFNGQKTLGQIVRSDAKVMTAENAWLSKTRNEQTKQWQYWINFFDVNSTGGYDAEFLTPPADARPPVIQFIPDRTTQEQKQVSFLVEASSPDGKPVTLTAAPLPAGAKFTVQAADPQIPGMARAIFDWTPAQGTTGTYLIVYSASDGVLSATRSANINVETNTIDRVPPAASNDSATTRQNANITLPILANDSLDAGAVTFNPAAIDLDPATPEVDTTHTVPGTGTFTVNPDGTVAFNPLSTFTGVSTIPYVVKDNIGQPTNVANITITVTGPGNPTGDATTDQPAANSDVGTTSLNTPITLDVKINDVASIGETLTLSTVDLDTGTVGIQTSRITSEGAWHSNSDGTVTFTPATSFTGVVNLPYAITDSANKTAQSTITITVTGGSAPMAQNDSGATWPVTPITLAILDNDTPSAGYRLVPNAVDLDTSTPNSVDATRIMPEGAWTANPDGTVTFTPIVDYNGGGQPFTGTASLPYAVTDGNGLTATATITLVVNPTVAPVAVDDSASTPFNTPVTLTPAGNDTVSPGAVLDPTTIDLDPNTPAVEQSKTTSESVWTVNPNGTVTFTPANNYTGTTAPVSYLIRDSLGHSATANLTVTAAPPGGLTLIGTVFHDLDGNKLQNSDELGTNAGGLYVTVLDDNNQPVATAPVNADGTYTLPVTANTSYTLVLSTTSMGTTASLPAGWTSTGENAGGMPDGTVDGQLSVSVGLSSVTGQNFGIRGANPVANNDTATTPHDTNVTMSILGNDAQGPGGTSFDPATVDLDPAAPDVQAIRMIADEGTYTVNLDGTVTFDPLPSFGGIATSIEYVVNDNLGRSTNTATITVVVGPDAVNDSASTAYNTPLNGSVTGNDVYPTGSTFVQSGPEVPGTTSQSGQITFDGNGGYVYTPPVGFGGTDTFTYTVCLPAPNDTVCDTAIVTITVVSTPQLRIQMTASTDKPSVGIPFTYTLTVTNTGTPTTVQTKVIDSVPAGIQLISVNSTGWSTGYPCMAAVPFPMPPLFQLLGGATLTCTYAGSIGTNASRTLILKAVPLTGATGSYVNQATVTGDGDTPNTTTCDGTAAANCDKATVTPKNPRIELIKRATLLPSDETSPSDGLANTGEELTYTFTITNRGDITLMALTLDDPQLNVGSLNCAGTTIQGNAFSLGGSLAPSDSVVCTGKHTVSSAEETAGRIKNTATAIGKSPDGTPWQSASNGGWDNTPPKGQISLTKTAVHNDMDGDGAFDQGETVTYKFIVRNVGAVVLQDVAVTDPLIPSITCPSTTLAVGAQVTCTASNYVLTLADETAGKVLNTATATGMTNPGNPVASADTKVLNAGQTAALALKKSAVLTTDADNDAALSSGDTLTYTLVATNTGGIALNNVTVIDNKLGTALQTAGVCSPQQSSVLSSGQQMVCTTAYTLQSGEANPIDNAANATGQPTGRLTPVDASADYVVPFTPPVESVFPLYTVGNRVWMETDNNGIYEPGPEEAGIDGVTVRLLLCDTDGAACTQAKQVDGTTLFPDQITAGGGYYQFANIPKNTTSQTYRVQVLPLNFTSPKPLYGAISSYDNNESVFPWTDNHDQGIGVSADDTIGVLSRAFDLGALPSGTTTFNSVDFGFAK